jgi:hypothetical protein
LAGESIAGIAFAHNESVDIVNGPYTARRGVVMVLINLDADPLYLIALGSAGGVVRVRQSQLRTSA